MAQSMATIPKPVYYKFDAVRGRLCEPSGMHWAPFNPNYDPGPPAQDIVRKGEPRSTLSTLPLLDTAQGSSSGLYRPPRLSYKPRQNTQGLRRLN